VEAIGGQDELGEVGGAEQPREGPVDQIARQDEVLQRRDAKQRLGQRAHEQIRGQVLWDTAHTISSRPARTCSVKQQQQAVRTRRVRSLELLKQSGMRPLRWLLLIRSSVRE
jgi:hypothetical protein